MDSSLLKLPCRLERGHQVSVPSHIVYRYRYILLNKSVTKKRNGKPVFSFVSLTLVSIFWWRTGGSVGFRCYIIQHTEWYCRAAQRDDVSTRPFALRRVSRPTFLISSSSFQAFIASPSHVVVATRQLNGNTPTASSWFSFSFHVDPNSCVML